MSNAQLIGRFDRRVKFQEQARVEDGIGGSAVAWVDALTLWANVLPLSGREAQQYGQSKDVRTYSVTIRKNPGFVTPLNTQYRLVLDPGLVGEQTMNIVSVRELELAGRFYELLCNAGTQPSAAAIQIFIWAYLGQVWQQSTIVWSE